MFNTEAAIEFLDRISNYGYGTARVFTARGAFGVIALVDVPAEEHARLREKIVTTAEAAGLPSACPELEAVLAKLSG